MWHLRLRVSISFVGGYAVCRDIPVEVEFDMCAGPGPLLCTPVR